MTTPIKALVHQYLETVWNQADLTALNNLTTATYTYRLGAQPKRDRAGMRQFIEMTHTAFPDCRIQIIDLIAEGDRVAVRWEGQVTHQGNFHGIPPTGKQVTVGGINIYRIVEGKVATEWEQTDSLGLLQQLGIRLSVEMFQVT
jgi:steroid delta-isomerase-like uncharacterized protein